MIGLRIAWTAPFVLAAPVLAQYGSDLPTVDLGYEIYRANSFNETGQYYNFSNVRYAAAPVGDLRFRAPQPPEVDRSSVNDGSQGRVCAQGLPAWIELATGFVSRYFTNQGNNITQSDVDLANFSVNAQSVMKTLDPRTTEDCLFLDVMVPQNIWQNKGNGDGAPVLVWIYGGGYVFGDKTEYYPAGLIYRSEANNAGGVIFVALNYRLGAFGWLAGPTFQESGTANAGLHDQRFALQWVQEHISEFGGDPNRVTVVGESAGGGSVFHQLTAYGGLVDLPFQQAVPQSTGWLPQTSAYGLDNQLSQFLSLAGVSTIDEARQLPVETLIEANAIQVGQSTWSSFTFGPAVDGSFVPALPGRLLLQGSYNPDVKVMVGHNANEGILFTNPLLTNQSSAEAYIKQIFPTITDAVLNQIFSVYYPPAPQNNGSLSYSDTTGRLALAIGEAAFACNANYIGKSYNAYAYLFSVPPSYHGEDLVYTFYNNGGFDFGDLLLNVTVAELLQDWIVTFAQNGSPSTPGINGIPEFDMYGFNTTVQDLGLSDVTYISDPAANERCAFWQKALYT